MRAFSLFIFIFLYLPVAVIVVFSFNAAPNMSAFTGLSLRWYAKAFSNPLAIAALTNSIVIALCSAVVSTAIGSAVAIGLMGTSRTTRIVVQSLMMLGLAVPGIVIGLASLVFFSAAFSGAEQAVAMLAGWEQAAKLFSFGRPTVIAAHSLFCTALVVEVISLRLRQLNPSWLEASNDLYAGRGETLWRVVVPFIVPAMVAGGLLSFVLSFDEFIIAFFVSGTKPTLPVYMFASVKRGATPELNAIATSMLTISILVSVVAFSFLRRGQARA